MNSLTMRLRYAEPSLGTTLATIEVAGFRALRDTITSPFRLSRYLKEQRWFTWFEFALLILLSVLVVALFFGALVWMIQGNGSILWITLLVWCCPQLLYRVPANYLDIVDYEEDDGWG